MNFSSLPLDQVYSIYYQFVGYFPKEYHFAISLILAGLIVYAVFKVIKRNFIFIILLLLLLPQSVPIFSGIWEGLLQILAFLTRR